MIWEFCAKFTRFLFGLFMLDITWHCRICGGIFPIDDKYISNHMKMHKENGEK